jgi:hypothetical protein
MGNTTTSVNVNIHAPGEWRTFSQTSLYGIFGIWAGLSIKATIPRKLRAKLNHSKSKEKTDEIQTNVKTLIHVHNE